MSEISVIIRNKNEERWIGYAIQSVIDFIPNSEIIVIDNGSIDNSAKIVSHFNIDDKLKEVDKSKYTNIIIENIKNYTPGKAINLGINKASNDICIVMSAHCEIKKINLKKIKNDLNHYISIFGKQIPVWCGKKITPRYIWSHFKDEEVINMYSELEQRYFHHNAIAIYRKSFLLNHPFDENLQAKEDRYWANDLIDNDHKILYSPDIVVHHHYTESGNTWKGLA